VKRPNWPLNLKASKAVVMSSVVMVEIMQQKKVSHASSGSGTDQAHGHAHTHAPCTQRGQFQSGEVAFGLLSHSSIPPGCAHHACVACRRAVKHAGCAHRNIYTYIHTRMHTHTHTHTHRHHHSLCDQKEEISSRTNRRPPTGAPNAEATPAAAPALLVE
jgi:hypothetical protein